MALEHGNIDVYLYGLTLLSTVHLLDGAYPAADTYGEIRQTCIIPGGETGNSAIILSRLGLKVKIDGPYLGNDTRIALPELLGKYNIDWSAFHYDNSFEGLKDMVLVDRESRTVFGKFGQYFGGGRKWGLPDRDSIKKAGIVSIDPFFGEQSLEAARYCKEAGKRYVTIDCKPGSELHVGATAVVISAEFLRNEYSGLAAEDVFKKYTDASDGLVIFTFGSKEILYGRRNGEINRFLPFKVEVKGTLGAGDTFRAGIVYGIYKGMTDENTVRFAAATAAEVCKRFPMYFDPPSLADITNLAGI